MTQTELIDVKLIEPTLFLDHRGYFLELFNSNRHQRNFVQDSLSVSRKGSLRGLHFQEPNPQGKLITVFSGVIFDVAVDIRVGSPTFGRHISVVLDGETHKQLWIPRGFAHGFLAISDEARMLYKCDALYDPKNSMSIRWDDPDININWGVTRPLLSDKDTEAPFLRDLTNKLPRYED